MNRASLHRQRLEDYERRSLLAELERNHWNRSKTARDLGLSYRTLLYKIERFALVSPEKEQEFSEPVSA